MIVGGSTAGLSLPPQRDGVAPTVEQILIAHAVARGGADAWRAVTSFVRSQSGPIVTIETTWVRAAAGRTDRVRIDQNSQYRSGETRAFDGETGWERGDSGLRQLSSAEVQELREDAAGMVELLAVKDLGLQVSMAGADSLRGRPVWKLAVSLRSGRKLTLWIDAQTWLEVGRSRQAATPDGATIEIWTAFGDYRKVDGLELPHTINDATATYKINVAVADSVFSRPGSS